MEIEIVKDDKYWIDKLDRRFYAEQFIWELFPNKPEEAYIDYFNEDFTELDLYNNNLSSIPALAFGKLIGLNYLDLSNNNLTSIPALAFGNLTQLKVLYLSNNNLTSIPDSIGNLSGLKILWLHNNKLSNIPDSIGNLSGLKELWLSNNNLSKQEQEIIQLILLPNTEIIF